MRVPHAGSDANDMEEISCLNFHHLKVDLAEHAAQGLILPSTLYRASTLGCVPAKDGNI